MATTRSFSAMLNDYLPNSLLKEEVVKRDWILSTVEKDDSWKQGPLVVAFKGAGASSVAWGSLTDSTDIAEDVFVRGEITTYPEAWFSMKFNHRDIMEHDKLSEQNLLKILPDTIEEGVQTFKETVSQVLLGNTYFALATADGDGSGNITVNRPERFQIGQKVYLEDGNTAAAAYYVTAVNMNTGVIVLSATRGGGGASLTGYTVAQAAKFYYDGMQTSANRMTGLKASLLSAANGGGSTLYGQTKTAYPYLQAQNISGASANASNLLDQIFDAQVQIRRIGKGNANKAVMSYKHWGSILKLLETGKGAFHQDVKSTKVSPYGWTECSIVGPKGMLDVVAVNEMDDSEIYLLDMKALKFYSNGFIRKRKSPDGVEYFEARATTGYSYIVDVCLFGDLVLERPSHCGIIHSISY